jgi:hypothetical protein
MAGTIAAIAGTASLAQGAEITWHTIDGGGGTSGGGDLRISGTVGQPDAGQMSGGSFELSGGFWAAPAAGGAPCFGDLDGDNQVGLSDLSALLSNFGLPAGLTYEDGDLDGDGDVDLADLADLLSSFGQDCG